MGLPLYVFLVLAGALGGFLSGMLGIGGGIIMFPLLLYAPHMLGLPALGVKNITGLTITQAFFAGLSALVFYRKERLVNRALVLTLGSSLFCASLAGSLISKKVGDGPLLLIYGTLALFAAVMMLTPRNYERDGIRSEDVTFNKPLALAYGIGAGFLLGMVGQAGAFLTIPLMLYVLKIPLRVALGSTLAIGLFSSTATLIGKVATGQVQFAMAAALLAGAIPMAYAGGAIGKRTHTKFLKWLLAAIICATAVKIWSGIL